ncbi:60S ribosomal protein L23a [Galemys pyrenaicus]|uniref:60S ribosomal protein L23a n=1 Tax=Galemys pyrenaicus TaxID=202257 RepID=A0A8J6DVC9_GALPY|nr:60S ribosomal protein L23a [Galemys pyrenaicus]
MSQPRCAHLRTPTPSLRCRHQACVQDADSLLDRKQMVGSTKARGSSQSDWDCCVGAGFSPEAGHGEASSRQPQRGKFRKLCKKLSNGDVLVLLLLQPVREGEDLEWGASLSSECGHVLGRSAAAAAALSVACQVGFQEDAILEVWPSLGEELRILRGGEISLRHNHVFLLPSLPLSTTCVSRDCGSHLGSTRHQGTSDVFRRAPPGETSCASFKVPLATESAMKKREDHGAFVLMVDVKVSQLPVQQAVKKPCDTDMAKVNTLVRPDRRRHVFGT